MKTVMRFALLLLVAIGNLPCVAQAQGDTTHRNRDYYTGSGEEASRHYVDRYQPEIDPRCGSGYGYPETDVDKRGRYVRHDSSTFTLYEGPCKNGVLNGTWKQYYFNRPWVLIECQFVEGKREGKYTRYARTGKVLETRTYKNDSLDGYLRRYGSQSGKLLEKTLYVNGKKDGFVFTLRDRDDYDPAGSRRKESDTIETAHYVMGKIEGLRIRYNWDGSFDEKQWYEQGRLVKSEDYDYYGKLIRTLDSVDSTRFAYVHWSGNEIQSKGFIRKINSGERINYHTANFQDAPSGYRADSSCVQVHPSKNTDSIRWLYRDKSIVWRDEYKHDAKGKASFTRTLYFPATYTPPATTSSAKGTWYNAKSKATESYYDGHLLGHWEYYDDGKTRLRIECDSTGKANFVKRYYPTGKDSARWSWSDATHTWLCHWKRPDETLGGRKEYDGDSLAHGEWTEYDSIGWKLRTRHFTHGVQSGEEIVYGKEEKILGQGRYTDGKKSGAWMEVEPDGTIISGTYTDGLREGLWEEWYDYNKTRKAAGKYVHGQRKGRWKCWDENGKKTKGKKY